ncbi:putative protein kinase [Trypanosoma rangeli]|uniref:Protein kinase domain-containing protein n=1 Tax=Trypanosoma rangeli TaxID=5698 RepID=A0A3R7K1T4_TRYRA|nr:putative protein kinase [Trypanosoma rangeli]RNE99068.1 putative protein kinase [Trypanosoma rangeli]|eukprot:RNE99068.1 putative protein kinase [Trypanosoma rangeli]
MQRLVCESCGEGDAVLASCAECGRRLCRLCISCASQCADCAAKAKRTNLTCDICRNKVKELYWCVVCDSMVCRACIHQSYMNRPTTVLCRGCRASSPLVMAAKTCGRCNEVVVDETTQYYCELCACPLCRNCLYASFECGVLKCRTCCPSPLRLMSNDRHIRKLSVGGWKSLITPILQKEPATSALTEVTAVVASARPSAPVTSTEAGVALSKYRQLSNREKLGEGGQGVVFKCKTLDNEEVVSKEMTFDDADRAVFEARLLQAERIRKLSHKHLIQYLDVIGLENPFKICVIMPYYSEGDLFNYIGRQRGPIEEHKLCSIILQIASALHYLHSQKPPLAHCDIKPDNILLLNREEQVLLMDLDLCHSCEAQVSTTTRVLHECRRNSPTLEYRAPEMVNSSGSTESDIFSLGVVSFVLATLPEFVMLRNDKGIMTVLNDSDWTPDSLAGAVRAAIRQHTRAYAEELIDLIIRMLQHRPASRPSAIEVMVRLTQAMENLLMRCDK